LARVWRMGGGRGVAGQITEYGGKVGAWLRRALLWWRSRQSLAPTRERSSREAARAARGAAPTRGKENKGDRGKRDVGRRTHATQSRPYPIPSTLNPIPSTQPLIHVANWAKALARWLSLSLVCGWSSPKVLSKPLGTKSES